MDYTKIPEHLHQTIIDLYNEMDIKQLLIIHNEYKLTTYNYNCCGIEGLIAWYKYGIENGKIKANK